MFEVYCRLCLQQVPLQNIHSLYGKHKEFLIRDKFYDLFQIQISDTEKLSTVCNDCLEKIETVDEIRTFFLEADKKFKAFLTGSPGGSNQEIDNDANTKQPSKGEISNDTSSANLEKDDKNASVDSNDGSIEEDCQIIKAEFEPSSQEPDEIEALEDEHHSDDDPVMIDDCENENLSESAFDLNKLEDQQPQSMEEDEEEEYIVHPSGVIYSSDQSSDLVTVDHQAMSDIISDGESSDMRELVEVSASVSGDNVFSIVTLDYQCNVCNDIFENAVTFIQHTNTVHKEEYTQNCKHCYLIYKTKEELIAHDCAVKPKIFECSECSNRFQTLKDLRTHTKHVHSSSQAYGETPRKVNLFKCDYCDLTMNSNQHLLDHVQAAHATEYVLHLCDQCDRSFGNTQTLKAHMAAHERNYKCSFCGKLCPTAVSLAGHENTHTKDQPFQCSQCGRNFAQYTSMRRHMKIHFNEKAYQCDFCAKRFRQRTVMLTHRRIHTGEKPFSCGTCNKTFRDHSTLAKHKRIHEKKPPANKN